MKTLREILHERREEIKDLSEVDRLRALAEAPVHMHGNAPFEEVSFTKLMDVSNKIMDNDFSLISKDFITVNDGKLSLYKANYGEYFRLGTYHKDTEEKSRFAVIFSLVFKKEKFKSNQKQLKNKNTVIIETVHTAKEFRGNKITTKVYELIMKENQIMSDSIQYDGAVNLWKNFIADKNMVVWIYDSLEDKIISKATPKTDISSIWSNGDERNYSKIRIRLIAQYL